MRLIDADALRESIITRQTEMSYEDAWALTCVDNAPTIEPQKWIPVSERLPKYEMDVLLQFTNNMCVGYFHPSDSWAIWSGGDWWTGMLEGDEEPIAWMPLPKPHEEGNNEVE